MQPRRHEDTKTRRREDRKHEKHEREKTSTPQRDDRIDSRSASGGQRARGDGHERPGQSQREDAKPGNNLRRDGQHRHIIVKDAATEPRDSIDHSAVQRRCVRALFYERNQTVVTEFLIVVIPHLGYTVREQQESVARVEREGLIVVRLVGKNAEHRSTLTESQDFFAPTDDDRRIVAGVGVPQLARSRIHERVEKRDELAGLDVPRNHPVHALAQFVGSDRLG
jgi:hypothetical protein